MGDQRRTFESQFFETSNGWQSVQDRMAFYGIPGASIAYVGGNQRLRRAPYGVLQAGGDQPVQEDTPFQAASLSKPHAAIGVQRLFESLGLDLASPVIGHTSWPIPCRTCGATINWSGNVTVEQTLQHKGGFIGRGNTYPLDACSGFQPGGGGFAGYAAGSALPTLDQILAGLSPANSPPIELTLPPGSFHYSGMGYVVMQRMLQDMTGEDFQGWMRSHILTPLGMSASSYALGPPSWLPAPAAGHAPSGQPIDGLRNSYPESAAAGLYTNAGDLCQTIIMLNSGGMIGETQILSPAQAAAMLGQQIGIFTGGQPGQPDYFFDHSGENCGFTAYLRGYPNQQAGMAIMVNLDDTDGSAGAFSIEAVNALIRVYGLEA